MVRKTKIFSFFRTRRQKEKETSFIKNGSALLEELIVSFNGRCNIPIRNFSAKEIVRATNDLSERLEISDGDRFMFRGSHDQRPVLIEWAPGQCSRDDYIGSPSRILQDIVITSQMSYHKNVLKLLGICLEFELPALVYEYEGTQLLSDLLSQPGNDGRSFPWRMRVRIANDIANALLYLHTAFPTPVIYRDLKPRKVIINCAGVAKLTDFSLSISLPPGELEVKDIVMGTFGFVDPEYVCSGVVTQKADVYSFGVLLLLLLTGFRHFWINHEDERIGIAEFVHDSLGKNQLEKIVDPRILGERSKTTEQDLQLQAFSTLAWKCTEQGSEDRPEMIEVAREIQRIERHHSWNAIRIFSLPRRREIL